MPFLYHVGEELKEECEQKQAYVHAVDIGIGGNYDVVVAQSVYAFFNVECGLKQIELVVFVQDLGRNSIGVLWLASEREHSLGLHIAYLGDGAGSRVALGDED